MTPMGNIVVLWGGGLLIANLFFDPVFQDLRSKATNGKTTLADINTSPVHMVVMGLLTLIVLGFLANANPKAARAVLIALAGLTVIWLMSYQRQKQAEGSKS